MMSISNNPRIPFSINQQGSLRPPQPGKNIIVQTVLNLEVWPFDEPVPRALMPMPNANRPAPDIGNFSWFEYGLRKGFPRILDVLNEAKIPTSAAINSKIIHSYPECAE